MDGRLRVTPEVLAEKADAVMKRLRVMREAYDAMNETVSNTKGYWVGEAGNVYRSRYKEMEPVMQEMEQRLKEHVKDLRKMAGVYSETEMEVKELAESLPADVIQ